MLVGPNPDTVAHAPADFDAVRPGPQWHDNGRAVSYRNDFRRDFLSVELRRIEDGMGFRIRLPARLQDALDVFLRIRTEQWTSRTLAHPLCKDGRIGRERHDDASTKERLPGVVIDHRPAAKRNDAHVSGQAFQRFRLESPKSTLAALGKNLGNRTTG